MKIRDILEEKGSRVIFIGPQVSLREALSTIAVNKVGALPVLDTTGEVLGIITERDLMRQVHLKVTLEEKTVGEVMTKDIVSGNLDDDIEYVMEVMTENRFRHMPVIENGSIVGIVSIGDAVKARLTEIKNYYEDLKSYVVGPAA